MQTKDGYSTTINMGDYYNITDTSQTSQGFQTANPMTFDIKSSILSGLIDKQFDGKTIKNPYEHLIRFYETCSMCNPNKVTVNQVKV